MKILKFNDTTDAWIGEHLTDELARFAADYDRTVVVADRGVASLYLAPMTEVLTREKIAHHSLVVPQGESAKTFASLEDLLTRLSELNLTRKDLLVALGGGVVSDLVGLAAGLYKRGIDHAIYSTTLLAQLDASLGGKTAINLPAGKNLIGMIKHPVRVFCDLSTLKTLPEKEKRNGVGELVKHGLLDDGWLLVELERAQTIDDLFTEEVVLKSLEVKKKFVNDPALSRDILNFGHTLGHAIEAVTGFGPLGHGEAVMQGMVLILAMTQKELLAARIQALSDRLGYPRFRVPEKREAFFEALARDKKRHGYQVDLILLDALGVPRVEAVTLDELKEEVETLFSRIERGDVPWR